MSAKARSTVKLAPPTATSIGVGDPKFMIWGNHPFVGGRPFRAVLLREFIRYAKGHSKVWFARRIEIANWWLEKGY